jgi:hypothetical protein
MRFSNFSALALGALLAIAPVAAKAQDLQGSTLNTVSTSSRQPRLAAGAAMFPVISPTCPYDQLTLSQLLNIAQATNPSLFATARSLLLTRALTPAAVRNLLVTQLCEGQNNGN